LFWDFVSWLGVSIMVATVGVQLWELKATLQGQTDLARQLRYLYVELLLYVAILMWANVLGSFVQHHLDGELGWKLFNAVLWTWIYNQNKDDRWKKRRRKLKKKVVEKAGRLVVVPAPNAA
jgi:hypothetical protein